MILRLPSVHLYLLQVHEVGSGDHGLKVHAGKQSKSKTEEALQEVSAAVCVFAHSIEEDYLAQQAALESHQAGDQPRKSKLVSGNKRQTDTETNAAAGTMKSKKSKLKA